MSCVTAYLVDGQRNIDVPVAFGGVMFRPGEWVYSDEDGILLSPIALDLQVLAVGRAW